MAKSSVADVRKPEVPHAALGNVKFKVEVVEFGLSARTKKLLAVDTAIVNSPASDPVMR